MSTISVVVPAQDSNAYSDKGDLEPFGGVSLIEWKISQLSDVFSKSQIFVSTESKSIVDIAKKEKVNVILRENCNSFNEVLTSAATNLNSEYILWANATAPFLSGREYQASVNSFIECDGKYDSLATVTRKKVYCLYDEKPLNFSPDSLKTRSDLSPVSLVTNGCFIFKREQFLRDKRIFGERILQYELDGLSSIEIRDVFDLTIARDLLAAYFIKNEL